MTWGAGSVPEWEVLSVVVWGVLWGVVLGVLAMDHSYYNALDHKTVHKFAETLRKQLYRLLILTCSHRRDFGPN